MDDRLTAQVEAADGKPVTIGYIRAGQGKPVVLIHGVGMHAGVWQPQVERLAERFDVIAVDMLGHGVSSLPPEKATLANYAMPVLGLLDRLGIESAFVVGHSMGALVAQEIALTAPERVKRLVSLNAVFRRPPEMAAAVRARAAGGAPADDPAALAVTLARWFGDPVPLPHAEAAIITRRALTAVDREGYLRTYRLFAEADTAHAERLSELAMPALFMTGERDPNSLPAMSATMARLAPKGRCVVIPGEKHMMALTAPDRVTEEIIAFLEERQSSAPLLMTTASEPPDPMDYRRALGAFLTGVTIVTTIDETGAPRGFTANSFTSVSLEPPLVLVCIGKQASSYSTFTTGKSFAVNVLGEHQKSISSIFASKAADKFAHVRWRPGFTGSPLIDAAVATFDCDLEQQVEAGDHMILIGRVRAFAHALGQPLGYCRGAYVSLGLSQEALADTSADMTVGAILEDDGRVLFFETEDGRYVLPAGRGIGSLADRDSLLGRLAARGIEAELGFLFAVWDEAGPKPHAHVYYRGTLRGAPKQGRLVALDDIAELPIASRPVKAMLARYVREREQDTFGIYAGNAVAGEVRRVVEPASP
ncbi:alpha/beta fold hydrolase [Rhodoligotrophos defluvii]|uniref:alpha/beta fold hydrolase n=1 Tax=Rhodoligotrophos defluvii TaxID=2561934 RepID=UPI0010CA0D69|nr:alpha/beta fold hydrolase [Rhodoligotrophos defluvii]